MDILQDSAFGKKGVAFILVALFICLSISPTTSTQEGGIATNSSDHGIYDQLLSVHASESIFLENTSVLQDTASFADQWITHTEVLDDPSEGITIGEITREYPQDPTVVEAARSFKPAGTYNTLFDLLSNRLLAYYIYIPYLGTDEDWNEGDLVPNPSEISTIVIGDGDIQTNWVYVDVDDGDGDGDDLTGADVRARMNPNLKSHGLLSRIASGGLFLEIEKLNPDWDEGLDFYFIKGFSYSTVSGLSSTNQTSLISGKLGFTHVPDHIEARMQASEVEFSGDMASIIGGASTGFAEITGPVELSWETDDDLPDLSVQAVFLSENETPDSEFKTWFEIISTPGTGKTYIPHTSQLTASSSNPAKGFDEIEWTSEDKLNVSIRFCEEKENTTYAIMEMQDIPAEVKIDLAEKTIDHGNVTEFRYTASDRMPLMDFREYQFIGEKVKDLSDSTPMRHVSTTVTDVPSSMYIEGTFEFGEEIEYPNITAGGGLIGTFVNNIITRVMARFTRIGRTVSSVPDKILEAAGGGGYFYLDGSSPFGVTFLLTDGIVPWADDPDERFFAFANSSSEHGLVDMVVSGRMRGVQHLNGLIGNETRGTMNILGETALYGYYLDPSRNFSSKVEMLQIPSELNFNMKTDSMHYSASGGDNSFKYISQQGDLRMLVEVVDLPPVFTMTSGDSGIDIRTEDGSIGRVRAIVTDGEAEYLQGNHVYVNQTENGTAVMSLSMDDIEGFRYNKDTGEFTLETAESKPMRLFFSTRGKRDAFLKLLVDPLPSYFSATIPETFNVTGINIPKVSATQGLLTVPNLLYSISDLGGLMLSTLHQSISNAVEGMGTYGGAFSFNYTSDQTTDIMGILLYGDAQESEVNWTHGFSAIQRITDSGPSLAAKIYFPGLPTEANIEFDTRPPTTRFRLELKNYYPRYNWLFLDLKGIQNKDARITLFDIPSPVDISLSAELTINMGAGGGIMSGMLNGTITSEGEPTDMGMLHLIGSQSEPTWTQVEMLLPSIPSDIGMDLEMGREINLEYSSSKNMEYVYLRAARKGDENIAYMYSVLHDIPSRVTGRIIPRTDLDIDGSMLQIMPDISFTTSENTLDAFIEADGEFMGQRGRFQLQVTNMSNYLFGRLENDTYRITSDGTDYVEIMAQGVPYSKQFTIDTMVFKVADLRSIDLRVEPLYGFYPVIEIVNGGTGNSEFIVRATIFDQAMNTVLVDMAFREGVLGDVPGYPNFMVNGGTLALDTAPRHVILVDPGMTIFFTAFTGGWL